MKEKLIQAGFAFEYSFINKKGEKCCLFSKDRKTVFQKAILNLLTNKVESIGEYDKSTMREKVEHRFSKICKILKSGKFKEENRKTTNRSGKESSREIAHL